MGGDLSVKQDVELPSGSGFDLVIGSFESGKEAKSRARHSIALLDKPKSTDSARLLGRSDVGVAR
jgi:hypothetical protein